MYELNKIDILSVHRYRNKCPIKHFYKPSVSGL